MAVKLDTINFIESKVNLDSYSSSDGFLGFCNSKVGWGDERCIEAFMEMLSRFIPDETLVSSIRIYGDIQVHAEMYELSENEIQVRDRLVENGIILNVDSEDEADSFHFAGSVSNDLLEDFVLYKSSIGELSYHGFLVGEDSGLVIYPHDDCGLGFICCYKRKRADVVEKLNECAERYTDILEFTINSS